MWTKKSSFVYIYLKIKRVTIPILIPLHVLWELLDALEDILSLFGGWKTKVDGPGVIRAIGGSVRELAKMGRFDLVDVDAGRAGERVKIKVCLR